MTLVDTVGRPIPPSGMVERLQQVHPNLGLRAFPQRDTGNTLLWGITYRWEVNDPRWQWVRSGKQSEDEAMDVVCFLPSDCSADQAYGYFVNNVKHGPTEDIRKLLNRVGEYNRTKDDKLVGEVAEVAAAQAAAELIEKKGNKSVGGIERKRRGK